MYKTDPNPDYNKIRVLYITGISGSGTTLLYRILYQRFEARACISSTFELPEDSPFHMKKVDTFNSIDDYLNDIKSHNRFNISDFQSIYGNEYLKRLFKHKNYINLNQHIMVDTAPILHQLRAKKLKESFPRSKFVLVFRNPVKSIEGLRRKWKLYSECDLSVLCDFWQFTHDQFIDDTKDFAEDIYWLSYEKLIKDTDAQLDKYAKLWKLTKRSEIKRFKDDIANNPKKGLRNVVDGVIQISEQADTDTFILAANEIDYIKEKLMPTYNKLLEKVL